MSGMMKSIFKAAGGDTSGDPGSGGWFSKILGSVQGQQPPAPGPTGPVMEDTAAAVRDKLLQRRGRRGAAANLMGGSTGFSGATSAAKTLLGG